MTDAKRIVAADIGGTNARFAFAHIKDGRVTGLDEPVKLRTSEHASFQAAWEEFGRRIGESLPSDVAIAFAGPVGGEVLQLTNGPWAIHPASIKARFDRVTILNDFGAIAHSVTALDNEHFQSICGPDRPLPGEGVITIVGPGTGLGTAILLRRGPHHHVIEAEAGHADFAPLDEIEDRIVAELRSRFGRVFVERVVSGPGLRNLYQALGAIEGQPPTIDDDVELWEAAIRATDSRAAAALDRFCLILGSVAGDLALAQGANAVVIAGGVGARLAEQLPKSGFRDRFLAKDPYEVRMAAMPVKLITHPEAGLFGAAAAFAHQYG